ncbi:MAG: hypothetical protein LBM38_03955 [Clostridiales bacterium]|jgi:hypothetical protein|nr:hypothetical protein [Clostridiales bacterium]
MSIREELWKMKIDEPIRFLLNKDGLESADIRAWFVEEVEGRGLEAKISLRNFDNTQKKTMSMEQLMLYGIGVNGDKKRLTEIVTDSKK